MAVRNRKLMNYKVVFNNQTDEYRGVYADVMDGLLRIDDVDGETIALYRKWDVVLRVGDKDSSPE